MRVVERCFSGAEAVEWLHKKLLKNPNFAQGVSKEQTARLLQKILRAGFIVPAFPEEEGTGLMLALLESSRLYRLADSAGDRLRTPGKSPSKQPLSTVDANATPLAPRRQRRTRADTDGGNTFKSVRDKENLNRTYFQSLPSNSLIVLDNERTWKEAFERQLAASLVGGKSIIFEASHVIFNMTKVSPKGVVQLSGSHLSDQDLPHWVLSAMKCLANWPKPPKTSDGQDSSLPQYPSFVYDVFSVVKEYFLDLKEPLVPYGLFDLFVAAQIRADEASCPQNLACFPLNTVPVQTSTPTTVNEDRRSFYCNPYGGNGPQQHERVARIRQTLELQANDHSPASHLSSLETSSSYGDSALSASMSTTAIMRHFLPPNTCFETAFMHEDPITRIVPQKQSETLHLRRRNTRLVVPPAPPSWDTRSIATQTSVEEQECAKRQPRWRRSSRQRKSIAVMEFSDEGKKTGLSTGSLKAPREVASSADNLLGDCAASHQRRHSMIPGGLNTTASCDNVILSKAVRKEKRKQQRLRQERAQSVDRLSTRKSSGQRFLTNHYQHLTVKTPIDELGFPVTDLQCVRAVPCRAEIGEEQHQTKVSAGGYVPSSGISTAVTDTLKLLALLLPPPNRRKLQLLLKFIVRVSANSKVSLVRGQPNLAFLLDTFSPAILRPSGLRKCDGSLCRRIVRLFLENYDAVWLPPESLRREVEEKVSTFFRARER